MILEFGIIPMLPNSLTIFTIQDRNELNEYVVRNALDSTAEPLPGYGRAGMVALRAYYGELAYKQGLDTFLANHPS